MFKFYDVDYEYIEYLKFFDNKIPDLKYELHNKFVCGIILSVNDINYYAPISHFNKKQRTNFPIYDRDKIIATIRFCFMFPAPISVLHEKDFRTINAIDSNYADLLKTEYKFCKNINNMNCILKKAQSVYKYGCNPNHHFYNECCKFKVLEDAFIKYINK